MSPASAGCTMTTTKVKSHLGDSLSICDFLFVFDFLPVFRRGHIFFSTSEEKFFVPAFNLFCCWLFIYFFLQHWAPFLCSCLCLVKQSVKEGLCVAVVFSKVRPAALQSRQTDFSPVALGLLVLASRESFTLFPLTATEKNKTDPINLATGGRLMSRPMTQILFFLWNNVNDPKHRDQSDTLGPPSRRR